MLGLVWNLPTGPGVSESCVLHAWFEKVGQVSSHVSISLEMKAFPGTQRRLCFRTKYK